MHTAARTIVFKHVNVVARLPGFPYGTTLGAKVNVEGWGQGEITGIETIGVEEALVEVRITLKLPY